MSTWNTGVDVSERAADLRPLLNEWVNLYSLACETFPQTRERWYVEQTLAGLIVAAGWHLDIRGISEVKTDRIGPANNRKGRADVVLDMTGTSTAFEAKIYWFNDPGGFETVLGKLEDACSEASSLEAAVADRRFGVSFGVMEKGGVPIEPLLQGSLARARDAALDFVAWSALITSQETVRYPGCLAIGRLASYAPPNR
ncbi:MAG: hypothetical protein AAB150_16475 [Pseudomonadota bacterium]